MLPRLKAVQGLLVVTVMTTEPKTEHFGPLLRRLCSTRVELMDNNENYKCIPI